MDQDDGQSWIGDRHGHEAEVDRVIDDRVENLAVVGAGDVDRNVRVLLLELGEDLREDVQAGAFIGAYDDLAAGHAFGFGDRGQDGLAGFKNFFSIFLEQLAGGGDGDFAAGTVEQLGADFFLQGADLGGDGRLCAKALLRRAGERAVARDLEKRF